MTLSTTIADSTLQVGLHAAQHNEVNTDVLAIQATIAGGLPGGLPTGGTANQVLAKIDSTNFHATWITSIGAQRPIGVGTWPEVTINPGDNWATAIAANPTGTIFVIKAGTHTQPANSLTVTTNDNLSFLGEDGAVVDGGMTMRTVTVTTTQGSNIMTSTGGFLASDFSATTPTLVWGAGLPNGWSQNASAQIIAFTDASHVTMDDTANSSGTSVATFVKPPGAGIDHFLTGNAKNITIAGLTIQNYAVPRNRAAVHPQVADDSTNLGLNWNVQNNVIQNNSNCGIRCCDQAYLASNIIQNNGDQGIGGTGNGVEVCGNEILGNNSYSNTIGFDAGAMKLTAGDGAYVHNNNIHNNNGVGIWFDVQGAGARVFANFVHDNAGSGIQVETSYTTDVYSNYVWGNGTAGNNSIFTGSAQIFVSASSHVAVFRNQVGQKGTGNYNGICVLMQDRAKGTTSRTFADGSITAAGTALTSTALAQFTTQDVGSFLTGVANTVYIQSVTSTTAAVLSGPPGTTVTNGSVTIATAVDNYGWTGTGQSNIRQRAYDIDIYQNNIRVTGSNMTAAGFITDTSESFLIGAYDSMLIGFRENNYNCPGGQNNWSWGGNNISLTQWRGFGNDHIKAIQTPTPNQGSWSLPAIEYIHSSGGAQRLNTIAADVNCMPVNFWTPSTVVQATGNFFSTVRPSVPNGFIYQCTTGGTTFTGPPAFPTTIGATVTETGGVVWKNIGTDPAAVSGAVTIDFSTGNTQILYPTAAVTSITAVNMPYNATVEIHIVMGTTAQTVTWVTSGPIALNGGVAVTAPAASKRVILSGYSDGTTVHEKWRSAPA